MNGSTPGGGTAERRGPAEQKPAAPSADALPPEAAPDVPSAETGPVMPAAPLTPAGSPPAGGRARPAGMAQLSGATQPAEITLSRRGPVRRFLHTHPRVTDTLVGLVYVLFTGTDLLLSPREEVPLNAVFLLPVLLACGVLLAVLRRRRPVPLVLLMSLADPLLLLFSGGFFSLGTGVVLALYSVALRHPPLVVFTMLAVATVPAGVTLLILGNSAVDGEPVVFWLTIPMLVMMYVIAAGLGLSVRRNRRHEQQIRAWAARNAELASIAERQRIAREMHDVVAHSLTVMIALSEGAAVVLRRDPRRAGEVLGELSGTGRSALADMRRVLGVLREDGGSAPLNPVQQGSLEALVDGFGSAGLPATLVRTGPPLPQDPGFVLTVHRIVQESLTNALRYAGGASRVEVRIERGGGRVRISVTDDGRSSSSTGGNGGFARGRAGDGDDGDDGAGPGPGSGRGLAGMGERAAIYGGTVHAGPLPAGGWRTSAVLREPTAEGTGPGHG